jgi:bile acid-coenzyme A ligase
MKDQRGMKIPMGALITALAAEKPQAAAITCGATSLTRRELDDRTTQRARSFVKSGVAHDSIVATTLPNSVELVEVIVATWKAGATPLVLPYAMPEAERNAVLDLARPSVVVGGTGYAGATMITVGDESWTSFPTDPLPPHAPRYWRASASGGSTGRPKLIMSTRRGEADPDEKTLRLRREGCVVVPGPLYHGAPFMFATQGLFRGKHVVLLPKFDPAATLDAVERHRADYMLLVPTMMNRILKLPDDVRANANLSSLEVMLHLGAACPPRLKQAWIDWIGPDQVHELYAGTEGQAMTWITGRQWLDHPGSVGRPVGGAEMVAFDADMRPLPPGELGEVFMRAPEQVGPTYEYVGAQRREHAGWESLGDIGWVDSDGFVYIADRRTDMIVSGGANVYPAEIESALEEHPDVAAAVVIGLPDDDLGARVHAIVETHGSLTEDDLRTFLSERLVRYKVPRSFELTDQTIRDEAGKARRSLFREHRLGTPSVSSETQSGS